MINFLSQFTVDAAPMLTYGPLGMITLWFMWRGEKVVSKISDLAHRIDGLTKALLVDMVERDHVGKHVKEYAQQTIAKIDARNKKDKDE